MVLREPNNPNTDEVVMAILRESVLLTGTQLAEGSVDGTGLTQCYIQESYQLSQGSFPAVLLFAEEQVFERDTNHGYKGIMIIVVRYYDRWDQNSLETQDQVLRRADRDIKRMQANLESADEVESIGQPSVVSVAKIHLNGYKGAFDDQLLPGLRTIYREMIITFNVLPYYVI